MNLTWIFPESLSYTIFENSEPKKIMTDKYLLEAPAGKEERYYSWRTAIGIQGVDRLEPSGYLIEIAQQNINESISVDQAIDLIGQYYTARDIRQTKIERTEEADKAAANIAKLLQEKAFSFSPIGLISIHKRIFSGIFSHAGQIRPFNISKNEWVLNGESIIYTPFSELMATLEYEINREKKFSYANLADEQKVVHIANFARDLWQIHPFQEGNTRTTIVFLIKMLRQLNFAVENKSFAENAWYFRNALVRANYRTVSTDADQKPLVMFFENLLLNAGHELKNRDLRLPALSKDGADNSPDVSE